MKKFRFPLEAAARVRDLAVREREIELAGALREKEAAELARRRSEESWRRSLGRARPGTVVDVRELLERDAERRRLRAVLGHDEERFRRSGDTVDSERSRLLTARRDAQAVEKLRERRYVEFLRAVLREEQKATDETASRRDQMKKAV